MSFIFDEKHEDTSKQYWEIWSRTKDLIGKDFDVETIHDDKYISTKIRSYKDEIRTDKR